MSQLYSRPLEMFVKSKLTYQKESKLAYKFLSCQLIHWHIHSHRNNAVNTACIMILYSNELNMMTLEGLL